MISSNAFVVREQKMVDTLIACDLLALAEAGESAVLISADTDFLPPLLQAARSPESEIAVLDPYGGWSERHRQIFTDAGVTYIEG